MFAFKFNLRCYTKETNEGTTLGYTSGLPLRYVMDPANQVLLSYEMNGEALPREHGAPLRALVPGQIGARSVKWLVKVGRCSCRLNG
jgi:DMSO/TMAO reductase YedYZ molybdopterin-dependent catalytic subunit